MSYLDDVASEIRGEVPPDLRGEDTEGLFRLYAVLALAKGGAVTARDVHNAWVAWMQERDPDHKSIRPFTELDRDTRRADDPFVVAIRRAAASPSGPRWASAD